MAGTQKNIFKSFDDFVDFQVEQINSLNTELREIKIAILNLKHEDKLSFNLKEAAHATGYGEDTLYSYVKQGIIPVTQVMRGSRIAISRDDLISFILSRKVNFLDYTARPVKKPNQKK